MRWRSSLQFTVFSRSLQFTVAVVSLHPEASGAVHSRVIIRKAPPDSYRD